MVTLEDKDFEKLIERIKELENRVAYQDIIIKRLNKQIEDYNKEFTSEEKPSN